MTLAVLPTHEMASEMNLYIYQDIVTQQNDHDGHAPHFTYRIYEEMSNFENYDKWYHDDSDQQISYRQ